MSLKFTDRIALFNVAAVAVTTALVFAIIYWVVSTTAYSHLDDDIAKEKAEVFSSLDWSGDSIILKKLPEWEEAEHNKVEVNPTFLQIVDTRGRVVFHSSNLLKGQFLINPKSDRKIFYSSVISNQKIRLGQFPIPNESGKIIGQLTIAISQQESFLILNHLFLVLIISFPLMMVVQYLVSAFAVTKGIAPIHRLIKTTSGIGLSNISTRLLLPQRKDELFDLTQTINELLQRIETSMQLQKQFTSDASHEIRTPLTAIRGTLEVLIRKPREVKVYEAKVADMILQVDRLVALLEQLLHLSRIESGAVVVKVESLNLYPIVSSLMEKWQQDCLEKSISLHLQMPPSTLVQGDKLFLEIILTNLVSNGIKYGKLHGNLYLLWDEATKTLLVKDDGVGIAAQHLPHIFNRFYRADESRSSAVKGYGLGLSIVKKLAEQQRIGLTAESVEGRGSTFRLQFPG